MSLRFWTMWQFVPSKAVNMENDQPIKFRKTSAGVELDLTSTPGETYLIDLLP